MGDKSGHVVTQDESHTHTHTQSPMHSADSAVEYVYIHNVTSISVNAMIYLVNKTFNSSLLVFTSETAY